MNALWIILSLVTVGHLAFAATGSFSGPEAYLMLCAQRLDWGFVEGPAGVPALIRLSTIVGGWSPFGVRMLSPLLCLLASFVLWQLSCRLRGKRVAFWSVIVFNLLPLTNVAALVMDSTMVVAALWIMTLSWSWILVANEKKSLLSWISFGFLLGMTTQVSYAVGWLLPLVIAMVIIKRKKIHWGGVVCAVLLFSLSWLGPLCWNIHHDWLQWSQITWGSFWSFTMPSLALFQESPLCSMMLFSIPFFLLGITNFIFPFETKKKRDDFYFLILLVVPFLFCVGGLGHNAPSFGLQLVLWAMILPAIVDFFLTTACRKKSGFALLCATAIWSLLLIFEIIPFSENDSSWFLPSPHGVEGIHKIAVELMRLRERTDASVESTASPQPPFLIAETPELAALLGAELPIHYPELEGAPSVFTPESPSFSSQFQLWPHYADAIASGVIDPLYTEEPKTSPFLGHNALYVTTKLAEDLPETISGAFSAVVPVSEATLQRGKRSEHLIIYECKNYQMLPL